ncbi:hypothetical protein H4R18_001344 [Coemansia javaensis]|uniref:Peptidase S1 domain-containing protein n=1 Tax=Coemansia javaensis TaxID=2761396 RepID=A0A9W8HF93_9FUNG|nr:hypothetical protein H4R18_001344 [Coemansia javaensis]
MAAYRTLLVLAALVACLTDAVVVPALGKRIVNGFLTPNNMAPYVVSVMRSMGGGMVYLCGGSIISPNHILTAAHCVYDDSAKGAATAVNMTIGYGSMNKSQQKKTVATAVYMHPKSYVGGKFNGTYDIAVIKVPTLAFDSSTAKIGIYTGAIQPGQNLLAMGWGQTEPNALMLSSLRGVIRQAGNAAQCKTKGTDYSVNNGPTICSPGLLTPEQSTCSGDSGTAIAINSNGTMLLAGLNSVAVTAGGGNCSSPTSTHFYIRAAHYVGFISESTGLPQSYFGATGGKDAGLAPANTTVTQTVVVMPTNMPGWLANY